MSRENVEKLLAHLESWTRGWGPGAWQRGEMDLSLFDSDVAYEDMNLPDHLGETYHGHEGVVRAAERWTESFEWMSVELEEIVDAGDHLLSFHRWRAKAQHTGIEIDEPLVYRWIFRDGRVTYFCSLGPGEGLVLYNDRAHARLDGGAAPDADAAESDTRAVVEGAWSRFTERPVESSDLDAGRFEPVFAEFYAPDVEWSMRVAGWLGSDTYRGHAGMHDLFADWFGTFAEVAFEIQRIEVAGRRAATVLTQRGLTPTGPPVEWRYGVVNDVRDGRIVCVEVHGSPESALARLQRSD
ncbi:MAG TPA: nuclear transport factor 2 family protein [Solirubrobacteraceae bacterium]|jgi:ketosteroid isomerase-like protein